MHIPGYRVIRKINQGGMSTVYLAIQISVGRVVALKVMAPTLNGDPSFSERFQREANIVGQLSHPNIVSIYDIGRHENWNYIAMDYLPGGSVHDRMMKGISASEAVNITRDIAIALDHAHEKGYVHRDIKPENILFRADDSAVLTDFGVAKGVGGVSRMTNVGQVVGTPHYMSPEQTRGKDLDARSDLYSLGVVFYEMLTGSVPFQGNEAVTIAIKHISAPIPKLPRPYEQYQKIIDKLLAKDPDQRFQKGRDLAQALDELEAAQKNVASVDPANLSTPTLLKALADASYRSIRWRLAKLARWRWAPKKGFYRRPTTRVAEMVWSDEDHNTLIATRIQDALAHKPRNRNLQLTIGLLSLAAAVLLAGLLYLWLSGDKETPATPSLAQQTTKPVEEKIEPAPAQISVETQTSVEPQSAVEPETEEEVVGTLVEIERTTEAEEPSTRTALEIYEPVPEDEIPVAESAPAIKPLEKLEGVVEEAPAPKPRHWALTLVTEPADARVRILNIVPRYKPGIRLEPGSYHIEISHPGYKTHTEWVELKAKDLRKTIALEPRRQFQGPFTSELPNGRQGPSMVPIPAGSFTMGHSADSSLAPTHRVNINYAFAISQFEITFAEYDLFAQATNRALPGDNRWGRDRRPVINVSWNDAQAYVAWLSKMTGERYRLPSESEWEYVARAGTRTNYWWGDEALEGKANCRRGCNSRFAGLFGAKTAPVGTYGANAFGVYDTAGNVAEWTQDCFAEGYAAKPRDGGALETSNCRARVVRGGSARDNLENLVNHARDYHPPEIYEAHLGFRVVMELD
jgi:serine/threonine-protein kinase PpkA